MNIKTKSTFSSVRAFKHSYVGCVALIVAGGLVQPALAVEVTHPTAANCQQTMSAIEQGIRSRMPADPVVAQVILNRWQEGRKLCGQGSNPLGLSKLQQAATILESGVLPTSHSQVQE